jgi:hypothetical protein
MPTIYLDDYEDQENKDYFQDVVARSLFVILQFTRTMADKRRKEYKDFDREECKRLEEDLTKFFA